MPRGGPCGRVELIHNKSLCMCVNMSMYNRVTHAMNVYNDNLKLERDSMFMERT